MPQKREPIKLTLSAFNNSLFEFWGTKQMFKMKKFLFALLAWGVGFCPFASAQKIYRDAAFAYVDDMPVRTYITDEVEVAVARDVKKRKYGFGEEVRFYITVLYNGDVPVNVGPKNIKLSVANGKGFTESDVLTAKEYLKRIKTNILLWGPDNIEKVASVETETKVRDVNSWGVETGSGINSTTTASMSVYTGAADEAYSSAEEFVKAEYLKTNTLLKGDELNGFVATKISRKAKKNPIEIKMELGGDIYIFNFEEI